VIIGIILVSRIEGSLLYALALQITGVVIVKDGWPDIVFITIQTIGLAIHALYNCIIHSRRYKLN
jgi:hypothetical protein